MNEKEQAIWEKLAARVADWAARVSEGESSIDEVVVEIQRFVAHYPCLLWEFAAVAVACVRDAMEGAVVGCTGNLFVASGSWFIKSAPADPDVIAMIQCATAMANRDSDMAHDVLIAHARVGGGRALLGVATCAVGTLANMVDDQAGVTVTRVDPDDVWRI